MASKYKFGIMALLAIISTGSIGLMVGHFIDKPPALPKNMVEAMLPTKVYFPTKIPSGYKLDASSSVIDAGQLFYSFKGSLNSAGTITVSEQALPPNFGTKALSALKNIPSTLTAIGTVYKLNTENENEIRYMVTTNDNVLIFIVSPNKNASTDIFNMANHLKRYKP